MAGARKASSSPRAGPSRWVAFGRPTSYSRPLYGGAFSGEPEPHARALDDDRLAMPTFPCRRDEDRGDARDRNCEQRAHDAAQVGADHDREQSGDWMQSHGAAGDAWRENVVLDHLHDDEECDHVEDER